MDSRKINHPKLTWTHNEVSIHLSSDDREFRLFSLCFCPIFFSSTELKFHHHSAPSSVGTSAGTSGLSTAAESTEALRPTEPHDFRLLEALEEARLRRRDFDAVSSALLLLSPAVAASVVSVSMGIGQESRSSA